MDLSDLWQQHKAFIITIATALLVLLIGRTIIGSTYDWQAARAGRDADNRELAKIETVPSSRLKELVNERTALEQRTQALATQLTFQVGSDYKLAATDRMAQSTYFELVDRKKEQLVIAPARLDITVPDNLGMPEAAPGDREEVARTLVALNVVNNVVEYAVAARVKRIVKIKYDSSAAARLKRQGFIGELTVHFEIEGTGRVLSDFFEILATAPQRSEPFLHVAQGSDLKADSTGDLVRATFDVKALSVDLERSVLGKESADKKSGK
ncbi:MAG: hypothetical protein U1E76_24985 [Planctomycetota bacterium]